MKQLNHDEQDRQRCSFGTRGPSSSLVLFVGVLANHEALCPGKQAMKHLDHSAVEAGPAAVPRLGHINVVQEAATSMKSARTFLQQPAPRIDPTSCGFSCERLRSAHSTCYIGLKRGMCTKGACMPSLSVSSPLSDVAAPNHRLPRSHLL